MWRDLNKSLLVVLVIAGLTVGTGCAPGRYNARKHAHVKTIVVVDMDEPAVAELPHHAPLINDVPFQDAYVAEKTLLIAASATTGAALGFFSLLMIGPQAIVIGPALLGVAGVLAVSEAEQKNSMEKRVDAVVPPESVREMLDGDFERQLAAVLQAHSYEVRQADGFDPALAKRRSTTTSGRTRQLLATSRLYPPTRQQVETHAERNSADAFARGQIMAYGLLKSTAPFRKDRFYPYVALNVSLIDTKSGKRIHERSYFGLDPKFFEGGVGAVTADPEAFERGLQNALASALAGVQEELRPSFSTLPEVDKKELRRKIKEAKRQAKEEAKRAREEAKRGGKPENASPAAETAEPVDAPSRPVFR